MPSGPITFAVIGRNDGSLLPAALRDVTSAARPGDRVLYVDGSSSDGSAEIARSHGVEVIAAPVGKGRSMEIALRSARTPYLLFFDADLERSEHNIAERLRDALQVEQPAMLVGEITQPGRRVVVIRRLHSAFMRALFPEARRPPGPAPMSGFRIISTDVDTGRLPPGYGIETHLNIRLVMDGERVTSTPVGEYIGPTRGYVTAAPMGVEIAQTILDSAESYGRLSPSMRPRWEAWSVPIIQLAMEAARDPSPWEELNERARELAWRPLPATAP
ncbi:MAG: glucosyl-3-phosphoglycerate synthase [Thermoleophilaceae bacterium]|nr:glucosyl-3-phosphoglycerate synthase [Thermoleophilaceae bacterium]MEA2368828.1 glucosyl-3-phosphoglycerate synthase [Thermoleophilaceae bacterium]